MNPTQHDDFAPFTIEVEPQRDVVRVCPHGEVDLVTVRRVRERIDELTAAGFERLLLDLREVTFLDSTGLRLLIELDHAARAGGWQLALIDGPPAVQRLFDLTGLR